jgi:hypothetical protein
MTVPYEHKQPKKRRENHPVVQQIRDAGAQADATGRWCALVLIAAGSVLFGGAFSLAMLLHLV